MNMCTPCNSYYMASLFTPNSTTMMHVFLFTEIEYMLFFTGQQETEQCLLPLVQQVNMFTVFYRKYPTEYSSFLS